MKQFAKIVKRFLSEENGATAVEHAGTLALILIVCPRKPKWSLSG